MTLRPRGAAARRLSLSKADQVAEIGPDTRKPRVAQSHDTATRKSGTVPHCSFRTPNDSAGDCSSSTPTAQLPTLPTQHSLYTTDAEVFVLPMQSLLVAKRRINFLHSLLAATSLSTPNSPVTNAEKHGIVRISPGERASDMRFLTFGNSSQAFLHASSEGRSHTRAFFAFWN